MGTLSKAYYFKPVKIIRDLVHGYINLTRFDLDLIDTVQFQRLSDIRQLTCQHVYPAARHTRFEHSLGVLELMRGAIKDLNRNGILGTPPDNNKPIISEQLQFNAAVAALLHDVGHCPFSHMGETQFDKMAVRQELAEEVKAFEALESCADLIAELDGTGKAGSVHEQLSCIVILRNYKALLSNLTQQAKANEETCEIKTDFELIIRSILGLEYKMDTTEDVRNNQVKNVIVRLLNSQIFDVDKLDYVMRDSYLTGIGTPAIDRQRLFRNMYLDDKYFLVFTSKAVPALQNMIDARDGLYLYVYNHHAVVYSDFLNTYISRRLFHNARDFFKYAYPTMRPDEVDREMEQSFISALGLVPKTYLFSVDAVTLEKHSDSAWLSLLNVIHTRYYRLAQVESPEGIKALIKSDLADSLSKLEKIPVSPENSEEAENVVVSGTKPALHSPVNQFSEAEKEVLAEKIYNTMLLIDQALRRDYLKPWWKTVFEFSNFMNHHFRDDRLRKHIGKYICDGGKHGLKADEMRSQIAKHVVYITQQLDKEEKGKPLGLLEKLNEGEFFVIQRSTNFFSPDTIEKLEIALKDSEILGPSADASRRVDKYYLKTLTNIIPQKDYSSIYAKESFYVFSKRPSPESLEKESNPAVAERKHYELLEKIFVFVTTSIVTRGEQDFVEKFHGQNSKDEEAKSKAEVYSAFVEYINWSET